MCTIKELVIVAHERIQLHPNIDTVIDVTAPSAGEGEVLRLQARQTRSFRDGRSADVNVIDTVLTREHAQRLAAWLNQWLAPPIGDPARVSAFVLDDEDWDEAVANDAKERR